MEQKNGFPANAFDCKIKYFLVSYSWQYALIHCYVCKSSQTDLVWHGVKREIYVHEEKVSTFSFGFLVTYC